MRYANSSNTRDLISFVVRRTRRLCVAATGSVAAIVVPGTLTVFSGCCQPKERAPFTQKELAQGYSDRFLLVQPHANVSASTLQKVEGESGLELRRTFKNFGTLRVLELKPGAPGDARKVAADLRLRRSNIYAKVELDHIRQAAAIPPSDANFARQWSLDNTRQFGGVLHADIGALGGWTKRTDASGVIVAVIDGGAQLDHPDLVKNLWCNPGEMGLDAEGQDKRTNGIDDDLNGYIDDVHGINTLFKPGEPGSSEPNDLAGHGTGIAGLIGAVGDNGLNLTGVAWSVQLMILKSLGPNGGSDSEEIACLDYAISKKAVIINASYERPPTDDPETWTALMAAYVGSSRVDLQACKLEYSIVSPK